VRQRSDAINGWRCDFCRTRFASNTAVLAARRDPPLVRLVKLLLAYWGIPRSQSIRASDTTSVRHVWYLIVRGHKMAEHAQEAAAARDAAARSYIQSAAGGSGSAAEEIQRLSDLKSQGLISDAEFEAGKAKALSS
jgi:hypothetical protein